MSASPFTPSHASFARSHDLIVAAALAQDWRKVETLAAPVASRVEEIFQSSFPSASDLRRARNIRQALRQARGQA